MLTSQSCDSIFSDNKTTNDGIQNANGDNDNGTINNVNTDGDADDSPEVDITISNVVSNFSVHCHLNLRQIATHGYNVVYKREQAMISMKLRVPQVTASIWSSGKITATGATTEESAKRAARRISRILQKMGFKVKFGRYRIVNVLGSCRLPFGIKIHEFSDFHRANASYEPELHPGATYRMKDIKAVLKIFQTGSITITAPCVGNVQTAVERIYPLVYEYKKPKPIQIDKSNKQRVKDKKISQKTRDDSSESDDYYDDVGLDISSDESVDDLYSDKSD